MRERCIRGDGEHKPGKCRPVTPEQTADRFDTKWLLCVGRSFDEFNQQPPGVDLQAEA